MLLFEVLTGYFYDVLLKHCVEITQVVNMMCLIQFSIVSGHFVDIIILTFTLLLYYLRWQ